MYSADTQYAERPKGDRSNGVPQKRPGVAPGDRAGNEERLDSGRPRSYRDFAGFRFWFPAPL